MEAIYYNCQWEKVKEFINNCGPAFFLAYQEKELLLSDLQTKIMVLILL